MPSTEHLVMEFPERFDLSDGDVRRLERFEELVWTSPEVCNECFSQVRHIEPTDVDLSETSLRNRPDAVHERTSKSEAAWSGYEAPTDRYGQTWCLECGSDLRAQTGSKPLDELKEYAKNLLEYTAVETDLEISPREMGTQLARLKTTRELAAGFDKQILAVAWARAIDVDTETDPCRLRKRSPSVTVSAD